MYIICMCSSNIYGTYVCTLFSYMVSSTSVLNSTKYIYCSTM